MPSLLRHANSSNGQRRRLTVWSDPKTVEIKDGIAQPVMALLPNIFLIGAQKAGTTAVAPGSAASLKIFIILREPVAREMSLYNHKASEFKRTQDMEAWFSNVADDDGNVMSFDEYTTQLKYYAMPFFSWQILVLSYDEVQNNPEMVEWRISQFLGKQFTGKLPRANVRGDAPVTKEKRTLPKQAGKFLIPLFHDKNEELYEFLEAHPGPPMEQHPFPRFEEYSLEELVDRATERVFKLAFLLLLLATKTILV
eukprot:scaffold1559_cov193-Alexandrium_tamarense.AAC.25